jgi:pyruvate ferredoxin oxidoreductase beta subunit/2-oxoisovalerate ferredoxin oxidoreductase beta subunit
MIKRPSKYTKEEYILPPHGGLSSCSGCGMVLALRYFLKTIGDKVVFVTTAGCAMPTLLNPKCILEYKGEPIPSIFVPLGSTAICAGGLKSAFTARGDRETQVVVWAGDGAIFDIGLGGVSGAAERNEDIICVCYDNESYMNTGNQRSSATPRGVKTATNPPPMLKMESKKDIMSIMIAHDIPYAATATIAYPDDLIKKVEKAKRTVGFRFLHILTPCVTGWQYPSRWTVRMSYLAVETRVFPLFEVEHGLMYRINREPRGIPVEEYTRKQGRYKDLTPGELIEFQKKVDDRWNRLNWLARYRA